MRLLKRANLRTLNEGIIDWLQSGLDVVGFIPGVGEVADGINALISLIRGNVLDAIFSVISMLPGLGDAIGKTGKYITKLLEPVAKMLKSGGPVADIAAKLGPEKFGKVKAAAEKISGPLQKHKDKLQDTFIALGEGDGDAVAKAMNLEVPDVFKKKFNAVVEKAGPSVAESGVDSTIDFLAEVGTDAAVRATGADDEEEVEPDEESAPQDPVAALRARAGLPPKKEPSKDVSALRARLGLSESKYVHHCSMAAHFYGREYVKEDLKRLAENIRQNCNSKKND